MNATVTVPFNATTADITAALDSIAANPGDPVNFPALVGNFTVAAGGGARQFVVTFTGAYAGRDVPTLGFVRATGTNAAGDTAPTATQTVQGGGGISYSYAIEFVAGTLSVPNGGGSISARNLNALTVGTANLTGTAVIAEQNGSGDVYVTDVNGSATGGVLPYRIEFRDQYAAQDVGQITVTNSGGAAFTTSTPVPGATAPTLSQG